MKRYIDTAFVNVDTASNGMWNISEQIVSYTRLYYIQAIVFGAQQLFIRNPVIWIYTHPKNGCYTDMCTLIPH